MSVDHIKAKALAKMWEHNRYVGSVAEISAAYLDLWKLAEAACVYEHQVEAIDALGKALKETA